MEGTISRFSRSRVISKVVKATVTSMTSYSEIEDLVEERPTLFTELWCLLKFYNNRRRVYLIRNYVDELKDNARSKFLKESEQKSDAFNCLLVASVFNDKLLKRFMLMDSVDIRSFQEMELTNEKGALSNSKSLSPSEVQSIANGLVGEFELKRQERKESIVESVLVEDSNTFLFVRRQIKEEIITQAKDSVLVKPAERIIVQFLKGGREILVSSRTKKVGREFVELFAKKAWGNGLTYRGIRSRNTQTQVKTFLSAIFSKQSNLSVLRVTVSQSPLDGFPDLDLRHPEGIGRSIRQLRDWGIDILGRIEHIARLTVRFMNTEVELCPVKNIDGTFEVGYSDSRLPIDNRAEFESVMKKEWKLDVKPKG